MPHFETHTLESAPEPSSKLLPNLRKLDGRRLLAFGGVAAALAWFATVPARSQDRPASSTTATLYARLGGYDGIAKFVDTAFPRVAAHPQLRRLFQGHARDSQVRQRQLIVDALCQASGGLLERRFRPDVVESE